MRPLDVRVGCHAVLVLVLAGVSLVLAACTPVRSTTAASITQAREQTRSSRPVPPPPPPLYVDDSLLERPGFPWCDDPQAHEAGGDAIRLFRRGCPPSLSEPMAFFDQRVSLRLPSSLEDHTVEHTPTFARSLANVEHPGCVEGQPGPLIRFGALGVIKAETEAESEADLATMLKALIETLGYPKGTSMRLVEQRDGAIEVVLDVPPTNELTEPAMAWLALHELEGQRAWVAFESHPNAFNALVRSFACSSRSLELRAQP